MKYLFGLLLMFSFSIVNSQQLQYEINSACATAIQDELIVNWSLGSIKYHEFCNDEFCLTGEWLNDNIVYGLDETLENTFIQIFPNPISDILYLEMTPDLAYPITLKIFNISGKLVYRQEISVITNTIYLENLNSGFYLLEFVDAESHKEIFRIIKN